MKALLIRPPEYRESAFAQIYPVYESVGLGYVCAALRKKGHEAEILDARVRDLDVGETVKEILRYEVDLIGFTMPSGILFPQVSEIIRRVRQANEHTHITIGGQYPTFGYRHILENLPGVDSIVRFEGEETLVDLMDSLDRRESWPGIRGLAIRTADSIVVTPNRRLIPDLNVLPFPARDTLSEIVRMSGVAIVSSSRGCYGGCKFCSVRAFNCPEDGAVWRGRDPENVVREISHIKDSFNPDALYFADDNIFGPGHRGSGRVRKIFELMANNALSFRTIDFFCRVDDVIRNPGIFELARTLGLNAVHLGVESGVQRMLDIYRKSATVQQNYQAIQILGGLGIESIVEFIFFNPWITFSEAGENIAFLRKTGIYDPYMLSSVLTVYTYAPIHKDIESGRLQLKPGRFGEDENIDPDSYRPYSFDDERVALLFRIVSSSFPLFEPVFYCLSLIENKLRASRNLGGDGAVRASLAESHLYIKRLMNETSMDLFLDAMEWVKSAERRSEGSVDDKIHQVGQKIENLSLVVSRVTSAILDEKREQ